MPELPDVEALRRAMEAECAGRRIEQVLVRESGGGEPCRGAWRTEGGYRACTVRATSRGADGRGQAEVGWWRAGPREGLLEERVFEGATGQQGGAARQGERGRDEGGRRGEGKEEEEKVHRHWVHQRRRT